MRKVKVVAFLFIVMLVGLSCIDKKSYNSPPGYDLNNPIKYFMPQSLKEISGIAFNRGKADSVYAEQDEDGKIYYFKLGDKQVNYSRFGKKGDYEDIAILGNQMILLRSNGVLFTFLFKQMRNPEIPNVQKLEGILPSGEYEGLYGDEQTNQLYVLCKHCSDEKASKIGGGYIFKLLPNGTVRQSGQFSIDVRLIEAQIGKKKVDFHPSALAKNPKTDEWYILSSVNKILVVADANWRVKQVYPIDHLLFLQPEGIAFDNQNNLYISNEGDKITAGTVYKFNYKH